MKGRKRHILVDTDGTLVRVVVLPANWQDKEGLRFLLRTVPLFTRWLKLLLDGGYISEPLAAWVLRTFTVEIEIVRRCDAQPGFKVLPQRWVVERTFAWLGKYRRLSKDYEASPLTSEAFIYAASIHILARRLVHA